jgi:hypothetical protein
MITGGNLPIPMLYEDYDFDTFKCYDMADLYPRYITLKNISFSEYDVIYKPQTLRELMD